MVEEDKTRQQCKEPVADLVVVKDWEAADSGEVADWEAAALGSCKHSRCRLGCRI